MSDSELMPLPAKKPRRATPEVLVEDEVLIQAEPGSGVKPSADGPRVITKERQLGGSPSSDKVTTPSSSSQPRDKNQQGPMDGRTAEEQGGMQALLSLSYQELSTKFKVQLEKYKTVHQTTLRELQACRKQRLLEKATSVARIRALEAQLEQQERGRRADIQLQVAAQVDVVLAENRILQILNEQRYQRILFLQQQFAEHCRAHSTPQAP